MSGRIGAHRVGGRFWFAASDSAALRLEAVEGTPPVFTFTENETETTFLYRGRMAVAGESVDMIETMLGLPLSSRDLRAVLTGCPSDSEGDVEAYHFGDTWIRFRVGDLAPEAFLKRHDSRVGWRLMALIGRAPGRAVRWRAEFHRDPQGWPTRVRVSSDQWIGESLDSFDVELTFRRVHVNPRIGPETFTLLVPSDAGAVTAEGVRGSLPKSAPFLVDSK